MVYTGLLVFTDDEPDGPPEPATSVRSIHSRLGVTDDESDGSSEPTASASSIHSRLGVTDDEPDGPSKPTISAHSIRSRLGVLPDSSSSAHDTGEIWLQQLYNSISFYTKIYQEFIFASKVALIAFSDRYMVGFVHIFCEISSSEMEFY